MTSTPAACPDCNNCGLPCLNEIHHPRQPSRCPKCKRPYDDARLTPGSLACSCQPDTSALKVDWVKWNVEEFREIVKRQADLETFYVCYEDVMELFAAYDSATAQIGDRLAELHRRIDRYIKENCALYEQLAAAQSKRDALQSKCEAYEKTLEIYARPDEAFPWRGVIARETLAKHKGGGGQ